MSLYLLPLLSRWLLNSRYFSLQHVLVSPNTEEYEMLLDDLKDRVMEHQGETIYVVGTGGKY